MNTKLIILVIILLIIIIRSNKKDIKNENFMNKNKTKKIYLFYNKKSKYSMNIIPVWQQLKQLIPNNSDVFFYDINTDEHENKKIIKKFHINKVPTIISKTENLYTKYNGDNKLLNIINFLKNNNIFINESLLNLQ